MTTTDRRLTRVKNQNRLPVGVWANWVVESILRMSMYGASYVIWDKDRKGEHAQRIFIFTFLRMSLLEMSLRSLWLCINARSIIMNYVVHMHQRCTFILDWTISATRQSVSEFPIGANNHQLHLHWDTRRWVWVRVSS